MRKVNLLLIALVLIALVVRVWHISYYPHPPNGDEVAFGYYGWSLLHFGTDEFGNRFPLSFSSIGDFKYPGLSYLNILPAAFFGLTDMTIRFWNIVSGIVLVGTLYYLALLLFKKKSIALWSAAFAALSPWSIIESRLGYENHISMVMVLVAFFLIAVVGCTEPVKNSFLEFLKRHKKVSLTSAFLLLIISLFTYAAQRVFVPIFVFGMFALTFHKKNYLKKSRKFLLVLLVVVSLFVGFLSASPVRRGRADEDMWKYSDKDRDRLLQVHVQAGKAPLHIPVLATRAFHNKYKVYAYQWLERYTDHFSPDFLYFKGELGSEAIPEMGVLLYIELLTVPFGILFLIENKKKYAFGALALLGWILVSPVASSLTFGGAHMHRASNLIPAFALLSGLGAYRMIEMVSKRLRLFAYIGLIGVFAFSALFALNQIFVHMPLENPWKNDFVNRTMAERVLASKDAYTAVVVPDDDYIYFLFYGKMTPQEFLEQSDITPITEARWERVNSIDNIYFKMPFNCPKSGKLEVLYVCKGEEIPQNSILLGTLYYPDGVSAYNFIEFVPLTQMQNPLPELPERVHYMVEVETSEKFPDGIIPSDYPSFW